MNTQIIIDAARAMVAGDKGLLAMDESNPTCNKRYAAAGIPQTEEFRRSYREMIITTPGLGAGIFICPCDTTTCSGDLAW
jgi:fructose-bisphosphate aldolase class I